MPELSVAERAARNMQKNRTKKRAARPASDKEPASKRPKTAASSRAVEFKTEQLKVIKDNLGAAPLTDPLTGKKCIYSALTAEPIFFFAYPIVLGAPQSKGNLNSTTPLLTGVSRPELVFTVLRKSFADLFPQLAPEQINDWQVWKWNRAFYGQGVVKKAQTWGDLQKKVYQLRFLGGDKLPTHCNIFNDIKGQKTSNAVDLSRVFPGEECFSRQFVFDLREKAEALAKEKNFIVPEGQIEEWLANREELSDDSDAEEQSEDEEYEQ